MMTGPRSGRPAGSGPVSTVASTKRTAVLLPGGDDGEQPATNNDQPRRHESAAGLELPRTSRTGMGVLAGRARRSPTSQAGSIFVSDPAFGKRRPGPAGAAPPTATGTPALAPGRLGDRLPGPGHHEPGRPPSGTAKADGNRRQGSCRSRARSRRTSSPPSTSCRTATSWWRRPRARRRTGGSTSGIRARRR